MHLARHLAPAMLEMHFYRIRPNRINLSQLGLLKELKCLKGPSHGRTRQTEEANCSLMTEINQLSGFVHNCDREWYNQKQIKWVLGNLFSFESGRWSEKTRIKHSWQITCDDQTMLTHSQQKQSYKAFHYSFHIRNCTSSALTYFITGNLYTKRWSLKTNKK